MHQEQDQEQCNQIAEAEIFELTYDEALCVAGGPETVNDPTR